MKILITGSNGLLGSKLVKLLQAEKVSYLASSRGVNRNPACPSENYTSMDITNGEEVDEVVGTYQPDAIIHTAAMTQVDACEEQKDTCDEINVRGTANVFKAAKKYNSHFNLLSTDFVFDGENGPYKETDEVHPLSYYALSKRKAEELLLDDGYKKWAITRTIIVFGYEDFLSRSNLVLWARQALLKGEALKIVEDQYRAPTDADDLAQACLTIARNDAQGIFHISGPETKSIIDWVRVIADFYKVNQELIQPVSSAKLNQAARRPPRTGFVLDKAKKQLDYTPLNFIDSLKKIEREITFSK